MTVSQWIISIVVGVLIFLIAFYIGKTTLILALLCGFIGLLGNVFVAWNQKNKNRK
ncbi:hypothetical protein HpBTM60_36200 [Helicobacter pylori]